MELRAAESNFAPESDDVEIGVRQIRLHDAEDFLEEGLVHGRHAHLARLQHDRPAESLAQQPPLLDEIPHLHQQLRRIERLDEIGVGANVESHQLVVAAGPRGEQDHGNVAGPLVTLQRATELVAVHLRHHHVTDDEIGKRGDREIESLGAVIRFEHAIERLQLLAHEMPYAEVVLDDQHRGRFVVLGEIGTR